MSVKKVKIVHEETGDESYVVETSVNAWKTVGWTPVEDEGSPEPPPSNGESKVTKLQNGGPVAPDASKKE
jgi:hypothetical protein